MSRLLSGAEKIWIERTRQITEEGFSFEHDDQWKKGQLLEAAITYAIGTYPTIHPEDTQETNANDVSELWPFEKERFKLSPDPIKNLIKAGAFIAAEIDRLEREKMLTGEGPSLPDDLFTRAFERGDLLKWVSARKGEESKHIRAETPLGNYMVSSRPSNQWVWAFTMNGKGWLPCDSLEHGKRLAQEDYLARKV